MFVKVRTSKSMPDKAIEYISGKNIMPEAQRRNLHSKTLSPSEEMKRTAQRFAKWGKHEERKTLSIIISPNPTDNPTEEQLLNVTNAVLDRFYSTIQGIVVLHRDKSGTADSNKPNPVLHSHFEGSIIDPITGKSLHFKQGDIKNIQRWADQYAYEQYGWKPFSPTRERKSHNLYRKSALKALTVRGSYSWKLDMTERIERQYSEATSYRDFTKRLKAEGIGVVSSRKDRRTGEISKLPELRFTFRYRGRNMVVKASSISKMLTTQEIKNRFPELEEKNNGQIFRFTNKGQGNTPKHMGKGFAVGQSGRGSYGGQEQTKPIRGRIDYGCIYCDHDREICRDCIRNRDGQGGNYERSGRTR